MSNQQNNGEAQVLGFRDCMSFCIGQIIGSGIMVLTGIALAKTGRGVPFGFLVAAAIIMITMVPLAVLGSAMPGTGGNYTYVREMIGRKSGFVYVIMFAVSQCLISTFALGFANYLQAILPWINVKVVALGLLVLCVLFNMVGLKTAAKLQTIMVAVLMAALCVYIIFGLPRVNFSVFTEPGAIMPNGAISFFTASALLYFPMGGAKFVAELGGEIKDPGKTIPRSMFLSTGIVAVFYALMGVVAAGVLPVEEVAGKTLVVSAKEIFPTSVYLFFVIGGALFALATTLNGTLSWITKGLFVASKEGWFPESLADTNKHGVPYKLLLIFFVIGAVPIVTGMDVSFISSLGVGLTVICNVLPVSAAYRLKETKAEAYENATFKIGNTALRVITVISVILLLVTGWLNLKDLNLVTWISLAVFAVLCVIYANLREKVVIEKAAGKK